MVPGLDSHLFFYQEVDDKAIARTLQLGLGSGFLLLTVSCCDFVGGSFCSIFINLEGLLVTRKLQVFEH